LRVLASDTGAAIVEFALVSPVLVMILMGLFDLGYNMYATAVLQGAMQDAARDSSIEAASTSAIDAVVLESVRDIVPDAQITFKRSAYQSFEAVGRAEDFIDANSDGMCNDGETFEDANANGQWDADQAASGQGGARDAVVYSASLSYPRALPIAPFVPGMDSHYRTKAATVLRNQPYDNVGGAPPTGTCV
jgi:Flp pilus assembly protein TadG